MKVLSMSRCIGRSGCEKTPNGGRGLCTTCYARHRTNGTLRNFPTMTERTKALRQQGYVPESKRSSNGRHVKAWRDKQMKLRVMIDGVLVHPNAPHGNVTSYNTYGCRGAMCREARRHYAITHETVIPLELRGSERPSPEDCLLFERSR